MTLVTRTAAKGIPPRVREPEPKSKSKSKGKATTTRKTKKGKINTNGKRAAEDSEDEEDPESSSEESEPAPKKKKRRQQQPRDIEVEVQVVESNVEPPEENVEVVAAGAAGPGSDDDEVSTVLFTCVQILTRLQDNGLNDHQRGAELQEKPSKKDSTLDLHTMMSDKVKVKFTLADGTSITEMGRWCNSCK
jgi:hypothetical protein